MTAPVRIEAEAWNDVRFRTLARLLGFADGLHALIKCAQLWSWQAEHYTPDAPTYVVDADTIQSALEADGAAEAMVRARLADAMPDGFRIRGAEGRIEWLWKKRQAARAGATARWSKEEHKPHASAIATRNAAGVPDPCPLVIALVPDQIPERESQETAPTASPPDRAQAIAELLTGEINRLARRGFSPKTGDTVKGCRRLAKERRTDEEILLVVHSKRSWINDPKMHDSFCPTTILRHFERYLDDARAKKPATPRLVSSSVDDEPDLSSYPKAT